jgi:hypothetical protein
MAVDGTGSWTRPVADLRVRGIETSGSTTRKLYKKFKKWSYNLIYYNSIMLMLNLSRIESHVVFLYM